MLLFPALEKIEGSPGGGEVSEKGSLGDFVFSSESKQKMPPKVKFVPPEKLQKGESAKRFFARFEAYCKVMEYTDDALKASQVLMLLGNEAFDYALCLEEVTRGSYTTLKKALITKFDGGELPSEYARRFQQLSLKAGEDLNAFMARLDDLAKMAYPTFTEPVLQPMVMSQFEMAMPHEVKKLVLLNSTKAKNRAELVEQCETYMQIQGMGTNRGGACARVDLEEDRWETVLKKVDALTVEVASIRAGTVEPRSEISGRNFARDFGGVECYKCHKFGHIARYCKSSRKNEEGCENCGNTGHSSRDCALNIRKGCHKCGNTGHTERDCKYKGKPLNFQ